jgi:hypothetical protein
LNKLWSVGVKNCMQYVFDPFLSRCLGQSQEIDRIPIKTFN